MNTIEKYGTMLVALIGAITGGVATYNDLSITGFDKKLRERKAFVESYESSINSAKIRGDKEKEKTLRIEYEKWEHSWRNARKTAFLTASITDLKSLHMSESSLNDLKLTLENSNPQMILTTLTPQEAGSAYLATGQFQEAGALFQRALAEDPQNAKYSGLYSLSLFGAYITEENNESRELLLKESELWSEAAVNLGLNETILKGRRKELASLIEKSKVIFPMQHEE